MNRKPLDRRSFLRHSGQTGAAVAAVSWTATSRAAESTAANEKLVLGIVGIKGRGSALGPAFAARDDCEVAYLADVDSRWFGDRSKAIEDAQGKAPKTVTDFRKVLDDQSVDAIVVATPDHWHALATVWGCQAEKHVYVEKPASHTPWEGRKMVEAARRYNRVVQVGLQNRSAPYNMEARAYIESGKLGTIHMCRVYNQKHWGNVAAVANSTAPETLDWDLWTGPAELTEYNANRHGKWNHYWNFSGGDIINDGVHQMDLARWLIGKDYPTSVYCAGGRYAEEGDLESPDTQLATYDFGDLVMTMELTLYTPYMLKTDPGVRNNDMFPLWPQNATRIEIYGTEGVMVAGRHGGGWQVFARPHQRQPVVAAEHYGRFPDPEHKQDFVDAIRSGRRPNCDVEEGHRSTLLCQWANISLRRGGRKLEIDGAAEQITNDDEAQRLARRTYRPPYVVPEQV